MPRERLFSRALVRLTPEGEGEDVADFLQGLVTQDVKGELPAWAGLLTPQGKTLFDFLVWPAGHGELLLDCEAEAVDDLIRRLSMYRLRRKIGIVRDYTLGVYWQHD
jgi:folate-binding Fe-S cluster repair protein YgfZ